jgi:hypothetical protein
MILTLVRPRLVCMVGSYLACAVTRASDADAVAYAFEGAAKSLEGTGEFRRSTRSVTSCAGRAAPRFTARR